MHGCKPTLLKLVFVVMFFRGHHFSGIWTLGYLWTYKCYNLVIIFIFTNNNMWNHRLLSLSSYKCQFQLPSVIAFQFTTSPPILGKPKCVISPKDNDKAIKANRILSSLFFAFWVGVAAWSERKDCDFSPFKFINCEKTFLVRKMNPCKFVFSMFKFCFTGAMQF